MMRSGDKLPAYVEPIYPPANHPRRLAS